MLDTAISARSEITDKTLVRSFSYIGGKWVKLKIALSADRRGLQAKFSGCFAQSNPHKCIQVFSTVFLPAPVELCAGFEYSKMTSTRQRRERRALPRARRVAGRAIKRRLHGFRPIGRCLHH